MTFPQTRFYIIIRTSMLGSVFFVRSYPFQVLIHLQVPPAPANGQPEGDREDTIPPPVSGVAAPGRVQDLHQFDVAYQRVVDHPPQPLVGVSNFHLSDTDPPFNQRHLGNRILRVRSTMWDMLKICQH
jgi:hypothetical protein